MQSLLGDQLARVALSVLVFERTSSSLLTAAVYALTFLPAFLGGLLLGGVADRYPRRRVLIGCDLVRAGLLAAMALPATPLPVVAALLTVVTVVGVPFRAAEPALLADLFTGERYVAALGLRTATYQASQLVGFAVGGAAVARRGRSQLGIGDRRRLLRRVRGDTAVGTAATPRGKNGPPAQRSELRAGIRLVSSNRHLRLLLGLAWLAGIWVIAEGLASPTRQRSGPDRPVSAGCWPPIQRETCSAPW